MKLVRNQYLITGIFGLLESDDGNLVCQTLEHAYEVDVDGFKSWEPKVPQGTYVCRRGDHLLHGMTKPFETFEVTHVEGHSGILFHCGNLNKDSDGCILLGLSEVEGKEILNSRSAFNVFMSALDGIDSFELVVE